MPDTRFFRRLSRVDLHRDQPRKTFLERSGPLSSGIKIRIAGAGPSMRRIMFILAAFSATQSFAAGAIVRDGGTLQLAEVTYRLDGIDAPAVDQMCIDDHADSWACGVD